MTIVKIQGLDVPCLCSKCAGIIGCSDEKWADADGKPYESYVCKRCLEKAGESLRQAAYVPHYAVVSAQLTAQNRRAVVRFVATMSTLLAAGLLLLALSAWIRS